MLILGGTTEARELAEALGAEAVLSLAGVTKRPLATPHRLGGFGGVAGLLDYLERAKHRAIIDATHPFAAQMSKHAVLAAQALGLPLLRLCRPAWPEAESWQNADDLAAAASILPAGARVFLSVGSRSIGPFLRRADLWFLTRSIEPPAQTPPDGDVILQRPPFTLASERALMQTHRITHLVSKNAGGAATYAKLEAAAQLGISVLMVKRPHLPVTITVESVAEAVKWVKNLGEDHDHNHRLRHV